MKAVTIAAAGAAVVTTVSAASHVKHMHAKLHANVARDTWVDWNATASTSATPVDGDTKTTTTTKAPVKAATTSTSSSTSFLWEDWTSTSLAVDPAKTSSTTSSTTSFVETWADWTTTSSLPVDPATTSTETWGDWSTSSPVDPASTSSTEEHTWGDWTTSDPVDPTSVATETWSDWSTSLPVDPTTTATETWSDWSSVEETTTITLASTVTETKYVEPVSAASTDSSTWADWTSTSSTTSSSVAVVAAATTSTTSSSWAFPSATVEADSCAISIITSYGLPTWYPTPVLAVNTSSSTTSSSSSSAAWVDWTTSTSSMPAAAAATTSSMSSYVSWADWTATTSSTPVDVAQATTTSTSSYFWGDWVSSATDNAVVASSSETAPGWAYPSGTASVSVNGGASSAWSGSSSTASGGSSSGSSGSSGISSNGDSWGMTYSPYTAQGGCKDAGTIASDMAVIAQKGFSSVRVYSTDCSTLENIGGSARDNGLKLILGVWISATGISGAQGQVQDIVAWAQWDIVELIVVGNEAVFNGYCSASELAGFISSSASAFKAAGYTGAITTTEPLSVWQDTSSASAFCSVVDIVGANLYAFFNADVTADKAGSFIQSEIDILNSVCSGKAVYVLESGWPHAGNCNGLACPSPENQATALKGIQATAGAQVVFLSYEDEPWKEPGQFDVEQYWGCVNVF